MYPGKAGIIGLGESNYRLLEYLLQNPHSEIFVSEKGKLDPEKREFLKAHNIEFEEGGHTGRLYNCDWFVLSPGVSPHSEVGEKIISSGKPFTTELEFALDKLKKPGRGVIVGITGTNGKSTVTTMIGHITKESGLKTFVGGNLGTPLISSINERYDVYVVEVSSFQLTWFGKKEKYFHLSSILNIAQDHLDYHKNMQEYALAKLKLIEMTSGYSIIDSEILDNFGNLMVDETKKHLIPFSSGKDGFFCLKDGKMRLHKLSVPLDSLNFSGTQNQVNAAITIGLAQFLGIHAHDALEKLRDYTFLNHRMQKCGQINGVTFINDSKATNAHAVISALENFDLEKVIIILSGKEKREDYTLLVKKISRVKHIIFLGDSLRSLIERLEKNGIIYDVVHSIDEALKKAIALSKAGDIVLFSPGGSSFDLYKNYKERGNDFVKAFNNLIKREEVI